MNNAQIPTVCIAATTGVGVFVSLMPDLNDIRKASPDSPTASDLRYSECVASAIVFGLGVLVAYLLKSTIPFTIATITVAVLVAVYESTMRKVGV
jgi:hypothetical protein